MNEKEADGDEEDDASGVFAKRRKEDESEDEENDEDERNPTEHSQGDVEGIEFGRTGPHPQLAVASGRASQIGVGIGLVFGEKQRGRAGVFKVGNRGVGKHDGGGRAGRIVGRPLGPARQRVGGVLTIQEVLAMAEFPASVVRSLAHRATDGHRQHGNQVRSGGVGVGNAGREKRGANDSRIGLRTAMRQRGHQVQIGHKVGRVGNHPPVHAAVPVLLREPIARNGPHVAPAPHQGRLAAQRRSLKRFAASKWQQLG